MVRTPRFLAAFGADKAFGQFVNRLEDQFARDVTLIFRDNLLTEILFKILADYEDQFAESGLDGIVDGVVHDGFTMRSQTVKLFQTSVTAAHTGSK